MVFPHFVIDLQIRNKKAAGGNSFLVGHEYFSLSNFSWLSFLVILFEKTFSEIKIS